MFCVSSVFTFECLKHVIQVLQGLSAPLTISMWPPHWNWDPNETKMKDKFTFIYWYFLLEPHLKMHRWDKTLNSWLLFSKQYFRIYTMISFGVRMGVWKPTLGRVKFTTWVTSPVSQPCSCLISWSETRCRSKVMEVPCYCFIKDTCSLRKKITTIFLFFFFSWGWSVTMALGF